MIRDKYPLFTNCPKQTANRVEGGHLFLGDQMKLIPLRQGGFTQVDNECFEMLSKYEWSVYDRYVETCVERKSVKMHRLILGLTNEKILSDHINGITTDNRRENLRICSTYQNQQNRKLQKDNTSGAKGVVKLPNGHFRVRVQAFGIRTDLGVYKTIEEAINVREKFAREKHGDFYRQS